MITAAGDLKKELSYLKLPLIGIHPIGGQRGQPQFNAGPTRAECCIGRAGGYYPNDTTIALKDLARDGQPCDEIPSHVVLDHVILKKIGSKWGKGVHLGLHK